MCAVSQLDKVLLYLDNSLLCVGLHELCKEMVSTVRHVLLLTYDVRYLLSQRRSPVGCGFL